jgi:hypothetical protein
LKLGGEDLKQKGEKKMKKIIVLFMGLVFLVSFTSTGNCESGEATLQKSGFLEGYYDKLGPGPEGQAELRWQKPGVDFGKYNKVMLDSVIFYLAEDSENKGIDGNEMKALTDTFNLELVKGFKDGYPILSQPGPDVVRIRIAITDLKQNNPSLSAVTSIIPIGLGVSLIKKGSSDSWVGSGATTMEVLAIDSMTNEVIIAGHDSRTAEFGDRFSKWKSADEAFKYWAGRMRWFMDRAHGIESKKKD